MKLLGLSCGRKMGNSEILLKEAMMAAQEVADIEVEIIRLLDLEMLPCTGCEDCTMSMMKGGDGLCKPYKDKDDMHYLRDKFAEADGMIIAAPVFALTAPGYLKIMHERFLGFGPNFLMSVFESAKRQPKVGATIAVGGTDWTHPALPLMNVPLFMLQMKVVDQLLVNWVARPGHVLLRDDAMENARKLGRRMAASMGKPASELRYLGDAPGTCPSCHSDMMMLGKKRQVVCPVCDIKGELSIVDDEIVVTFDDESLKSNRWTPEGAHHHFADIKRQHLYFEERKPEVVEKGKKHRAFHPYVKPPRVKPRGPHVETTENDDDSWAEAMLPGAHS